MNKLSINSKVSLLEIIMSVLIFAAAGIIMLNCFALARFTQARANDKTLAGSILQSDLEIIKSLKTVDELHDYLKESYETKEEGNNSYTYTKYYDKNWKQSGIKEYSVTISVSGQTDEIVKSGQLIKITILAEKEEPYPFINKGQEIYSIESKKFFPSLGGGHGE